MKKKNMVFHIPKWQILKLFAVFQTLDESFQSSIYNLLFQSRGTVCQMHTLSLYCVFVMELEILQYTANFSHSSFLNWHFFFGKLQRQCYKNMIVLVFMSKHYPWILSKSKDFFASTYTTVTAACPIIEIFFSHAPQ